MGSLRNPVGPLPSTIYWRRRAVAATLVALLALLIAWVVTSGGGGGKKGKPGADGSHAPSSITPGPSSSGPAISQNPGGRDESGGTGGSGSGGADAGSGDASSGTGTGGTSGSDAIGGGAGGGAGGGDSAGQRVPAGSSLPDCTAAAVQLTLRNPKNTYEPGEKPKFELVAKNVSATSCKVDFGPKAAVVTVTSADDKVIWSSKDCPKDGSLLFQVPANSTITHAVQWNRSKSAPNCATPPPGSATPGTYLIEASLPGMPVQRTSIVLSKD
ncbi:hypothetical protein [Streptomyces sp. NBC_01465]|uniref:hypothetical protein n=1 Tax=Streptomyces sp. NBC_01465 TaxID=2903878 RepID=UPI002E2F5D69|nr:hypothetical protein [Streptomyces sp. NBC_01465]